MEGHVENLWAEKNRVDDQAFFPYDFDIGLPMKEKKIAKSFLINVKRVSEDMKGETKSLDQRSYCTYVQYDLCSRLFAKHI